MAARCCHPASSNKKVRWAETVVENRHRPTYKTPPLTTQYARVPGKAFTNPDPKVKEVYNFLNLHEPSRVEEAEAIVSRYRQNGRVDYLMSEMKARYGCCSRRCRLCASGAMDEDSLLLELSMCGPVSEFGEPYSGEDLEALLVMCGGGRDSLYSNCSALDGCEPEPPNATRPSHSLSHDSSISSTCSLSSSSSGCLLPQNPEKPGFFSTIASSGESQDSNSPPLMQFRRIESKQCKTMDQDPSYSTTLEFQRRDRRIESDPFDEFEDFDMH